MISRHLITILTFATFLTVSASEAFSTESTEKSKYNLIKGEKLVKSLCMTCHKAPGQPGRLAPPMMGVKRHYTQKHKDLDSFVAAVRDWCKKPNEKNSLLPPHAIKMFKLMPALPLPDQDLENAAAYIYGQDGDCDQGAKKRASATGCDHGAKKEASTTGCDHSVAKASAPVKNYGLALNKKDKWLVDDHTREVFVTMNKMIEVKSIDSSSVDNLKAKGLVLPKELDSLIAGCKLAGAAHDELHKYLVLYIPAVEALAKSGKATEANKVNELLELYGKFFK